MGRTTLIVIASAAALAAFYLWRQRQLGRLPTKEEQAWLDKQLKTPRTPGGPNEEEQKWLDKQIKESEDADVRDRTLAV